MTSDHVAYVVYTGDADERGSKHLWSGRPRAAVTVEVRRVCSTSSIPSERLQFASRRVQPAAAKPTITHSKLLSDLLGGLQCSVDTIRSRLKETGNSYWHHLTADQLVRLIHETVHSGENGRAIGHRL